MAVSTWLPAAGSPPRRCSTSSSAEALFSGARRDGRGRSRARPGPHLRSPRDRRGARGPTRASSPRTGATAPARSGDRPDRQLDTVAPDHGLDRPHVRAEQQQLVTQAGARATAWSSVARSQTGSADHPPPDGRATPVADPGLGEQPEYGRAHNPEPQQRRDNPRGDAVPDPPCHRMCSRLECKSAICAPQHRLRDRSPLGFVRVQQLGTRLASRDESKLPREVNRVADGEVHPLPTRGAVDVRGVPDEQCASRPEPFSEPAVYAEQRGPADVADRCRRGEVLIEPPLQLCGAHVGIRIVRDARTAWRRETGRHGPEDPVPAAA